MERAIPLTQVVPSYCGVLAVLAFSISDPAARFRRMAFEEPAGVRKRAEPGIGLPGYDNPAPEVSRRDGARRTPKATRYGRYLSQGNSPFR